MTRMDQIYFPDFVTADYWHPAQQKFKVWTEQYIDENAYSQTDLGTHKSASLDYQYKCSRVITVPPASDRTEGGPSLESTNSASYLYDYSSTWQGGGRHYRAAGSDSWQSPFFTHRHGFKVNWTANDTSASPQSTSGEYFCNGNGYPQVTPYTSLLEVTCDADTYRYSRTWPKNPTPGGEHSGQTHTVKLSEKVTLEDVLDLAKADIPNRWPAQDSGGAGAWYVPAESSVMYDFQRMLSDTMIIWYADCHYHVEAAGTSNPSTGELPEGTFRWQEVHYGITNLQVPDIVRCREWRGKAGERSPEYTLKGDDGGPGHWTVIADWNFLPLEVVAHPVLADGSISPDVSDVQLSTPSPVVEVASCALGNVRLNNDGNLVGDLTVSGTIASTVCDTLPSPRGTIDSAQLYVNGAPDSFADIAVSVSKQENGPVGRQYPYSGSFNQVIQSVPLVSGNNVFQFAAKDKVYGMPGYHTWSAEVRVTEPEDDESGVNLPPSFFSMTVSLPAATLNAQQADQVTVAYTDGTNSVSGIQLNETSADSGVFVGTVNQQAVQLTLADVSTLTATKRDVLAASLAIGGTEVQVKLTESAAASGVFSGGYTTQPLGGSAQQTVSGTQAGGSAAGSTPSNPATPSGAPALPNVQADYPTPADQSNGGEFYAYSLELKGPLTSLLSQGELFVTMGGTRFQVKTDSTTGKALLQREDGNKPATFSYRLSERGVSLSVNGDEVLRDLKARNATFSNGLLAGLGMGGADLIVGTSNIALQPVNDVLKFGLTASIGIVWAGKSILGQDTEGVKTVIGNLGKSAQQESQQKADMAKALAALSQTVISSPAEFEAAILKMLTVAAEGGAAEDVASVAAESDVMRKSIIFCAETLPQLWKDLGSATPAEQGYYTGRVLFEVLTIVIPEAKAGNLAKLTKAETLTKFMSKDFFRKLPAATARVITEEVPKLLKTKMCFLAGTPVLTKNGLKNIEHIHAGDLVWSRDEFTQQESWMPVTDTFITHPSEIYRLTYSVRGPPEPGLGGTNRTETLGVTAPHPFWVLNREKPCFVPAAELETGDELRLADGGTAEVQTKTLEAKANGETFTTYNFEVVQFHTYFVGHACVWVHNAGAPCERFFAIFEHFKAKYGDAAQAWARTESRLMAFSSKPETTRTLGSALDDVLRKELIPGHQGEFFTSTRSLTNTENLGEHVWKHIYDLKDMASLTPDGASYVKRALELSANSVGQGNILVAEGIRSRSALERLVLDQATGEFTIKVLTGPEAGRIRTLFRPTRTTPYQYFMREVARDGLILK